MSLKAETGKNTPMVTFYDVPAEALVDELAARLEDLIDEPDWAAFAKSGTDRELPPDQEDFWYRRAASILRIVAKDGPVGVERLTTRYGGGKEGTVRYGVAPRHRVDGSGNVVRTILQQLEDAGLVDEPQHTDGRIVTPEGRSLLDETAGDTIDALDRADLERYV